MSAVSSSRGATFVTLGVVTVLVEVCVDGGTCGAVTTLSRVFSDDFSDGSAGPEGIGGDMNSMLGGRGLG
jgi:hypothetical protein